MAYAQAGPGAAGRVRRQATRALDYARRFARRRREAHGLVLMYHRVASLRADPWGLGVSPAHFESQIRQLREHADIVPLERLRGELRIGRRSRPAVAITFDDGYVDNLSVAKPILERHQAPATVFLATGYVGRRADFWWDRLAKLVLHGAELPARIELTAGGEAFRCNDPWLVARDGRGAAARRLLHDRLWQWLSGRAEDERDRALVELERSLDARPAPDPNDWPMTPDQVREIANSGLVDIGAHCVTHPMLSRLSSARKALEIAQSRADCQRLTGRDPACFAFPHGDLDAESLALVREAGFAVACTSRPDLVWSADDARATPRIMVRNESGGSLLRRLRWYWFA